MKLLYVGLVVFLVTVSYGSCKVKQSKTHSKAKERLFKSVGRQVNPSPRNTSSPTGNNKTDINVVNGLSTNTTALQGSPKSKMTTYYNRSKLTQANHPTYSGLRWKVSRKNNKTLRISTKRQNVVSLTGDPNRQRLFHLDETGTLHRHEVGPEEFSTPEGKTETFTNEKELSETAPSDVQPSQQTRTEEPAPRQMLGPLEFPHQTESLPPGYPMYSPHSPHTQPIAFLPTPRLLPPPRLNNYYPPPLPRLPYVVPRIHRVPYPVPVPIRQPPIMKPVAVPVPYPVASPPKIHRVPYPVAVPIRSPPEIRVQRVPVPVPVPRPIVRPMVRPPFFFRRPIVPMPVGLDECATNPCRNGGTCYLVEETYKCHCATGFKGTHCEDTSKCHPNPCENFGECTVLKDGYECSCRKGFRGSRCEVKDQCHPTPCRNGGSCTSVGNEYACSCIYGFIGKNCEAESKCFPLNPCQHGGTCHEDDIDYKCTCTAGWDGISCEIPDPCSRNPCFHGGECSALGNTYTCSCPTAYLGKTCELESQCHTNNPCKNGGHCIEHELDGYKCHCNNRWNGENCEIPTYSTY